MQRRSTTAEETSNKATPDAASANASAGGKGASRGACLAGHWEALDSFGQAEAIKRAELIGRSGGRLAFQLLGVERQASPLDYHQTVIAPLFVRGAMTTARHDHWRVECTARTVQTGQKRLANDPRVDAFIRHWEIGQRDERAHPAGAND